MQSLFKHPENFTIQSSELWSLLFYIFPYSYSRASQWQNILSLTYNWILQVYDKWGFTETNKIQLHLKIVLCWYSAIQNREV